MGLLKIWGLLILAGTALAQEATSKDWRISASLGNSVGIGTFVADYARSPSWSTSLSLNPSYRIPVFWGLPRITLSASGLMSIWWLNSYQTTATNVSNRISFSDTSFQASMPGMFEFGTSGFSLGSSVGFSVPTSVLSRVTSRILSLNASLPFNWSKWGFSAGWTPSYSGWFYSQSYISAPCFEMSPGVINPQNIDLSVDQISQGLVIVKNTDERIGDGTCLVAGRQILGTLANNFSLGWSNKQHAVNLGLGWFINFLRPVSRRPGLSSDHATGQNFTELTMGRIAYSYTMPIETDLSFSAGVMSTQATYTRSGNLAFPFFDFVTPGNNQTQVFIQANVGI